MNPTENKFVGYIPECNIKKTDWQKHSVILMLKLLSSAFRLHNATG